MVVKWFGCQMIWDSNDWAIKRVESWSFCLSIWTCSPVSYSAFSGLRGPNLLLPDHSQTKLFCEASFKNQASKLKNEAFLRDFLQKSSFEAQKRSFSARLQNNWGFEAQKRSFFARLPSKMKLWSSQTKSFCETCLKNWRSKTKHVCETSFKNDMWTRRLASELQYVLAIFK